MGTTQQNGTRRQRTLSEPATKTSTEPSGATPPDPKDAPGKGLKKQRSPSSSDNVKEENGMMERMIDMLKIEKMEKHFRCPVCLTLPICDIYQCKYGHLLCSDCYSNLTQPISCPSCRVSMVNTPIRCRAAEHVSLIFMNNGLFYD